MEDDLLYKILVFLVFSFILFAVLFYIIKACQACCRINYKYLVDGKYENEPTVLRESSPPLIADYPEQLEDEINILQLLPQELPLVTPTSPERQLLPAGSSQCSCSSTIPQHSAFHNVQHSDDPPSYEEAIRMSMTGI
ncbi:hypothetical protein ACKWTF_014202 [Chironomus riparius]